MSDQTGTGSPERIDVVNYAGKSRLSGDDFNSTVTIVISGRHRACSLFGSWGWRAGNALVKRCVLLSLWPHARSGNQAGKSPRVGQTIKNMTLGSF